MSQIDQIDLFISRIALLSRAADHRAESIRWQKEALPKCGNCSHWMKTQECPAEASGRKPSCNGVACSDYGESTSPFGNVQEYKARAIQEQREAERLLYLAQASAEGK